MLSIGLRKQLLMDDHVVEDIWNLRRTVHQPRRHPANPVVVRDRPWEGPGPYLQGSVLPDEARGVLRMYYQVFDPEGYRKRVGAYQACYAESSDGLNWHKPGLGQFEWRGSSDNNLLRIGANRTQGMCVQRFDHTPPPQRYWIVYDDQAQPYGSGLCLAFSPDGLHWTPHAGNPIALGHSDTTHTLVWDEARGLYTIYMRPRFYAGPWKRRVARIVSADGHAWSEPEVVLWPDELDPPEIYGMPVFLHETVYIGRPEMFPRDTEIIYQQLAWSRDGRHWQRHPERPTWLGLGQPGDFDCGMVAASATPIRIGDELWQYYGGWSAPHHSETREAAIGVATMRVDGFVSWDAGPDEGVLQTRPFEIGGDAIEINAAVEAGGAIAAELWGASARRERGEAVAGYSRAEADAFTGDALAHRLAWRGSGDLSALRGQAVRLRLHMQRAALYAFQVVQTR